jgi:hypothetical protein
MLPLPPLSPAHSCNLPQPLKDTLDRIGAKCTTIANNTPTTATRLVPILKIQRFELEKVTDNLFRPKAGSFPMQVTKYLAENSNLQTISYQRTPGVLDSSSRRLPQDYYLAVLLQGVAATQEQANINVEEEYDALLSCIHFFCIFLWKCYLIYVVITSKADTLAPPASWLPTYNLTPIIGATVVLGVAFSLLLKK